MKGKTVLLLHGFASSANSSKAQFLRERFKAHPEAQFRAIDFNPTPQDFQYTTVTGWINRLRQYLLDHDLAKVSLIGSSMGALTAVNYAHRFGGVEKMLLLAPAFFWLSGGLGELGLEEWRKAGAVPVLHYAFEREIPVRYDLEADGRLYQTPVAPAAPTTIVHGRRDDVVPIEGSRVYAARFHDQVQLIEVDSDHRLSDQMELIWQQVQTFLLGVPS